MTAENWGALTLVLLGFALLCSLAAWTAAGRRIWAPVTLAVLAAAAVVAAAPDQVDRRRPVGDHPARRASAARSRSPAAGR